MNCPELCPECGSEKNKTLVKKCLFSDTMITYLDSFISEDQEVVSGIQSPKIDKTSDMGEDIRSIMKMAQERNCPRLKPFMERYEASENLKAFISSLKKSQGQEPKTGAK